MDTSLRLLKDLCKHVASLAGRTSYAAQNANYYSNSEGAERYWKDSRSLLHQAEDDLAQLLAERKAQRS